MKFVKSSLLVKLVILILVVYATVTLVRLRSQINEKEAEAAGLTIRRTVGRVAVRGRARLAVCAVRRRAVRFLGRRFGGSIGGCGLGFRIISRSVRRGAAAGREREQHRRRQQDS